MAINFYFEQTIALAQWNRLNVFISSIFNKEKCPPTDIDYIFCGDEYLLNINKEFLKHDFYTDIITFDLSNKKNHFQTGEIYISVDRVKDNAKIQGVSVMQELHRVIFHGALHLCGYKDKTKLQKRLMQMREDYYLSKYGLFI